MSGRRVAAILCLVLLAACSAATTAPKKPTAFGIVTGTLAPTYPFRNVEHGLGGTVTFTANDGQQYTVRVPDSGDFTYRLPVGTYTADGGSPGILSASGAEYRCYDLQTVRIVKDTVTHTAVTCPAPG